MHGVRVFIAVALLVLVALDARLMLQVIPRAARYVW